MAIGRYDQRKILEEAEANAIGTEYLRADLLPGKSVDATKALLLEYLDQRILFYSRQDSQKAQQINRRTNELQTALWNEVMPIARTQANPVNTLVVSGMNDVLNSEGYTQAAWWNRIPTAAWSLMVAMAICANLVVGFGARNFKHNAGLFMLFPFVIATAFFLIADIDSPRGGIIRVEPRNLIQLKETLHPRATAPLLKALSQP